MIEQRRYLAYLLRLWQEGAAPGGEALGGSSDPVGDPLGNPPLWRASLQSSQSDVLRGFASLADLFSFLEEETRSNRARPGRPDSEEL